LVSSVALALVLLVSLPSSMVASAAPPMAVIAEELGYFPVQNPRDGTVTMIPQRVRRTSTAQAVDLAEYLRERRIVLAGTYWCPHTTRQKELLGREAFAKLEYIECAPRGYQANPKLCVEQHVQGYPTWIDLSSSSSSNNAGKSVQLAGERSLLEVAQFAGYTGTWNDQVEQQSNPPPPLGGAACK